QAVLVDPALIAPAARRGAEDREGVPDLRQLAVSRPNPFAGLERPAGDQPDGWPAANPVSGIVPEQRVPFRRGPSYGRHHFASHRLVAPGLVVVFLVLRPNGRGPTCVKSM